MHPSQAINPDNALVYATFDRMWVESEEGWTVAGNNGGAATPDYVYMGPSTAQPRQITEERGIELSGAQYAFTRLSFDADEPFSIAVLSDSAMAAAGWLAATFDSVANIGVRFGASAASTLVAELRNAGGSIVQTAALPSNAGREKRLYILTYDGSGTTAGLKIHVDDRTLTSVASGTTVAGSLDSGRVLTIGSQSSASGFLVGKIFGVAIYPFELNEAMRLTLRGRMLRETKASAPAVYGSFQAASDYSTHFTMFDRTDDTVNCGQNLTLNTNTTFTMSAWVYVVPWADTSLNATVLARQTADFPFGWAFLIRLVGGEYTPRLELVYATTQSIRVYGLQTVPPYEWHHFAITWDGNASPGAAGVKLYIDGNICDNVVLNDGLGALPTHQPNAELGIGTRIYPTQPLVFSGGLDEISTWNKTFSQAEITELYNLGKPSNLSLHSASSNLLTWWRMGDGDIYPTIRDHGSSGYHGTMTNMTADSFKYRSDYP